MKNLTQSINQIPFVRRSISRSLWRRGILPILLLLASLALSPKARAVDPPPDGGYPAANTAEGENALFNLDTRAASGNTAIGFDALYSNTTGEFNTANGYLALSNHTTGTYNTANGAFALVGTYPSTGSNNTANGVKALYSNTTGSNNTANGVQALKKNTTGSYNTANGFDALYLNKTGVDNTATGAFALQSNTTGNYNTASGYRALAFNTTGYYNTANGFDALGGNTTGFVNVANGYQALFSNTNGAGNTANGANALFNNTTGFNNTADGVGALVNNTTGSSNIGLGIGAGNALTTGDNNIDIGNSGVAGEAQTIRIGKVGTQTVAFIAGISGVAVPNGVGVIVGADGQLGTVVSSERFKHEIKPMDKASEAILALQPVTFRYNHELDPKGIRQFGLVAEQVEKVSPDLVARDDQGNVYTVRYEAVNAMLLNEFLKEHRKVEVQNRKLQKLESNIAQQQKDFQSTIAQQQKDFQSAVAQQQKEIAALTASLKEQASQIQKVTRLRRVEASKPASQLVVNNQ